MTQEEEIKNLQDELDKGLKDFSETGKLRLEQGRLEIDKRVKNIIEIYSNDIRNLSIISGTVAPFSLTLLTVEKLDSNIYLLILGFALLLLNITITQFFIRRLSEGQDVKSVKAQFNLMMAEFELENTGNTTKDTTERVNQMFNYQKSISEAENLLDFGKYNLGIQEVRSKLRKYNKITNLIFSLGALFIVLSVIVNPIINWVISNCLR